MVRRTRTAKRLGMRHDLNYFKRWSASRRWRLWLSVGLPLVLVAWLLAGVPGGDSSALSPGPMSHQHAFIGKKCETCHVWKVAGVRVASFRKVVTDEACLECHQAPAHKTNQPFTPACGSCHAEHTGSPDLKHVAAGNCVQCHQNGMGQFLPVSAFPTQHPEFTMLRDGRRDPGTVAFNHELHLKSIQGPDGRVQLECSDCHRTAKDAGAKWEFASSQGADASAKPHVNAGLMVPLTYERNCEACHRLQFDPRMQDAVPHKEPDVIHTFLVERYKNYLTANPAAWRTREPVARLIPASESSASSSASTPEQWVNGQVHIAEQLLWRKTCKECHQMDYGSASGEALPKILAAKLTTVWMPHARFQHDAHAALSCTSCHTKTPTSKDTADVLVPSIKTCAQCHNASFQSENHAETGCFECHQYHDWSKRTLFKGTKSIDQLTGK